MEEGGNIPQVQVTPKETETCRIQYKYRKPIGNIWRVDIIITPRSDHQGKLPIKRGVVPMMKKAVPSVCRDYWMRQARMGNIILIAVTSASPSIRCIAQSKMEDGGDRSDRRLLALPPPPTIFLGNKKTPL